MIKELSVILPLHNKEHCIEHTIKTLLSVELIEKLQIIIIENESTDNSLITVKKIVSSIGAEQDIMILTSTKGKGTAIRKGIPFIKYEWCLITGADLPFGTTAIEFFSKSSKKYDLYLGSKGHPESIISRKFSRRLYSQFFYFLRKIFLKLKYLDTHGSMIVRSKNLREVSKLLLQKEFFIDTEIVFNFEILKFKIIEIPITLVNDDMTSTVRPLRDGLKILKETIILGLRKK